MEINLVDQIVRKGYGFKAYGRVLTSGPVFEHILDFYPRERGVDRQHVRAAVPMHVQSAKPVVSPVYDSCAEEVEVDERWLVHHLRLHAFAPSHNGRVPDGGGT